MIRSDSKTVIASIASESFQLIYIDPPFNTRKIQERRTFSSTRSPEGKQLGFGGMLYQSAELARKSYLDSYDDYLGFIMPLLEQAKRLLAEDGTLYFHIDYRESHYCKIALDEIFGRDNFLNEIIWAYDYGGKPKNKWPAKHDNILVYVKNRKKYFFNSDAVEREPYMAPGLVTPDKAARGKLPTDVWWHTIVPTNSYEKTGYPTQKPEGILRRIIQASSEPGRWVLDFFSGSGTTGAVARQLGRRFVLVDTNPDAIEVTAKRLGDKGIRYLT